MFKAFADLLTFQVLRLPQGSRLTESANFFLYDIPKIFFMLICIVFIVSVIRTFFPPEKIRAILSRKNELVGNILAACFGVFVPFCTCSAIPLFLGMLQSGVPLGATMSFLVSSPTVNEIALILLWGLFGWRISLAYIISGLIIAILAGFIIGKLKMEKYVEKGFMRTDSEDAAASENAKSWLERFEYAYEYTRNTFLDVWLYVIIGVGLGAFIHGYVPVEFVAKYAGKSNPFAVIFAVILGVPLYAKEAGVIPLVQALMEKGLSLGTTLAFMMSVTALSLPEFIILSKVLKPRLLFTFFGTVAVGIILIGYLFNYVF